MNKGGFGRFGKGWRWTQSASNSSLIVLPANREMFREFGHFGLSVFGQFADFSGNSGDWIDLRKRPNREKQGICSEFGSARPCGVSSAAALLDDKQTQTFFHRSVAKTGSNSH